MEIEKMIEVLKGLIANYKLSYEDVLSNLLYGKISLVVEALEGAVLALEKQVPKKPIHKFIKNSNIHPDYDDSGIEYNCPVCKNIVGYLIQDRDVYSLKNAHCSFCGQKVDWSNGNGN